MIVDYNGVLKSLRQALADYAVGDDDGDGIDEDGDRTTDIVAPIDDLVKSLVQAIDAAEAHLAACGFDIARLHGATGFDRIEALADATAALRRSDEDQRRYEVIAREVFSRFTALLPEPAAYSFVVRRDDIETIYKRLIEPRDFADVTEVLRQLHRIVNEAIRAGQPGEDHRDGLVVDLSQLDFDRLREEFATKARRKETVLHDIREVVRQALARMMAVNPLTMDYYRRYQEIVAEYNREKDRTTVEQTFRQLMQLACDMDAEQRRAVEEGLSPRELAMFDLLKKESLPKTERERLKQGSRELLQALRTLIRPMPNWTENTTTQSRVRVEIRDRLFEVMPDPGFSETERDATVERVFNFVFGQNVAGAFGDDAEVA